MYYSRLEMYDVEMKGRYMNVVIMNLWNRRSMKFGINLEVRIVKEIR
jgi:hypothetical protein